MTNWSLPALHPNLTFWAIVPLILRFFLKRITGFITRPFKRLCFGCFGGLGDHQSTLKINQEYREQLSRALSGTSWRRTVIHDIVLPRRWGGFELPLARITGTFIPRDSVLFLVDSEDLLNATRALWLFQAADTSILWNRPDWHTARSTLGMSSCSLLVMAVSRLVLWHLMQPILYAFVFFEYYERIDAAQQFLGWIVFGREMCYVLAVSLLTCLSPTFLLIDPWTTLPTPEVSELPNMMQNYDFEAMDPIMLERVLRKGMNWLSISMFFVFAPEKVMVLWLANILEARGYPRIHNYMSVVGTLLFGAADSCAVAAIIVGACHRTLFPPLAVGYALPVLSFLFQLYLTWRILRFYWQIRHFRRPQQESMRCGPQCVRDDLDVARSWG